MAFVLRWEIANASSINNRTAESAVFNEHGFEWKATMSPGSLRLTGHATFWLTCVHPRGGEWSCEADVEFVIPNRMNLALRHKSLLKLNDGERVHRCNDATWSAIINPENGYVSNDAVIIEFHFTNFKSECYALDPAPILDLTKFASPNEAGNVTLVIGDKKLSVSKDYLAIHSPVFAAMFFKDYAEKGKDAVEIKEVVYEEFIDLLQVIFPVQGDITDSTVLHVLALGDRFQMKQIAVFAEKHLLISTKFTVPEKLKLADLYRLEKLREHCLKTYSTVQQIGALESTSEYADYSFVMKAAICDRMMQLVKDKAMN